MSLLLRLILLMDLLGPNGLNPPPPAPVTGQSSVKQGTITAVTTLGNTSGGTIYFRNSADSAESLQWLVADSDAVVRAQVDSEIDCELAFTVLETIKGTPKKGESIKVYRAGNLLSSSAGPDLLLFLLQNQGLDGTPHPLRLRWNCNIALNGSLEAVLMDFRRITEVPAILEAARRAAAYPSPKPLKKLDLRSYGTPIGPFGNMQLAVPLDERLEKLAQDWASQNSLDGRLIALEGIRPFKSSTNIDVVKRLLSDTRSKTPSSLGKWAMGYYHVRAAAADLLLSWGVPVPDLPDSGPILQYRPLSISTTKTAAICAAAVTWCIIFYLAARWTKSRGLDLGFWRLNFTALSFALAAFAGWIWIRSHLYVDELMFPLGQTQHQIASYNGGIQYVVVREWTLPTITVTGHFDHELVEDQWAIDRMNRSVTKESMGFVVTNGLVIGPSRIVHPFSLFRIPYWIMIIPVIFILAMAVFRIVRLIIRLKRGHCRHCGYDLRESRGGQCPECGTKSPTKIAVPQESLLHHV